MNIQAEKLKLIAWLLALKDDSTLEKLIWLRDDQAEASDWWEEISEAEKAAIERGLDDIKNGRITVHEEVRRKYEKWL